MSRNVISSHDISISILQLVEGTSCPVQKVMELTDIPENVDMDTAAIIPKPIVQFRDKNWRVSSC